MTPTIHRPEASTRSVAGAESREKILEVGEALFARSGFAGVGMREVAHDVGLSKSALFHHFGSKVELYSEVLHRALSRLEARVGPAFRSDAAAPEQLDAVIDGLIDFLAEDPATPRLAMRAIFESDPFLGDHTLRHEPGRVPHLDRDLEPFELLLVDLIGRMQMLLERGIEAGDFREVSVPDTLQTLIGMTVYHFASGDFGEALLAESLFSTKAVRRRKREVKAFVRRAIVRNAGEGRAAAAVARST